jgi:Class III cytochrome C family
VVTSRRVITGAMVVVLLALAIAARHGRRDAIETRPLLPLTFAHVDHRSVNCITCHHNFVDSTGQGLCINCHKTNSKVRLEIEPIFHTLCRDCHVAKRTSGEDAGPVRRCADCHTADDQP